MKNKVIVITGGSSGIGKALAKEFGLHRSKVVITGRRSAPLLQARAELRKMGVDAHCFVGDVSKAEHNLQLVDYVIELFGRIDVLVNNAGVSMRAMFEDVDMDVFKRVMDINFYGTVTLTKYALPYLLQSKGHIVGISSVSGRRGLPARSAYSASKYAMEGFMESLRTEVMKKCVRVTTVCPGFVASNIRQTALLADGSLQGESPRNEQKMMTAEEAAHLIYNAVLNGKRDVILTSQGKLAVWLNKFFPAWMDKITLREMGRENALPAPKRKKEIAIMEESFN